MGAVGRCPAALRALIPGWGFAPQQNRSGPIHWSAL